ncbi:phosphatase PAP2 family protein [Luteibacter sp.]|uniref:phosphatase PAP2 family protein n=1 Tax=Luteibacter sp. TaxID=1886636 RepID=UPI003F7DD0BC
MWHAITSFGDSALLLPLIAWMTLVLAFAPHRRDAIRWVVAAIACGGAVAFSKLIFMAWGIGPPGLDYTGISGHTALSVLTWPSLAALLVRKVRGPLAWIAIAAGACLGLLVGLSRLALEVHSVSEVIMGALLGAIVATWFIHGLNRTDALPTWHALLLGMGVIALWLVFYGRIFPSQHLLKDIAMWVSGHSHVFTRRPHAP